MTRLLSWAALAYAVTLGACSPRGSPEPAGDRDQPAAFGARAFSPTLAADPREQALAALARDAFRREARFREAADPGALFRATAAPQAALEGGLWSPEQLFRAGAQLFELTFTPELGYGARDLPSLARFHRGRRGGPDARRCTACHWRGGPAGAGDAADNAYLDGDGDAQSSALERNPRSLVGAGLVEILAREMTLDLARLRAAVLADAASSGAPRRVELVSKGVSFGFLGARPDGTLDASGVRGVDADLSIKPFGWKGNVPSLRDAIEDELLVHHGMESEHLVATAPAERVGPFGGDDPDGDGVSHEITEGQVTALTFFVAMQEVPVAIVPVDAEASRARGEGEARFVALGCTACHVPSLPLAGTRFELASRSGGPALGVDLARAGAQPRLAPSADGGYALALFSDLRRHDLGKGLADRRADRGVPGEQFLTPPLWGIARSRPYLHDARAPTLQDAILQHGGEALAARNAFLKLTEPERGTVRVYLTSLTRARRMVVP